MHLHSHPLLGRIKEHHGHAARGQGCAFLHQLVSCFHAFTRRVNRTRFANHDLLLTISYYTEQFNNLAPDLLPPEYRQRAGRPLVALALFNLQPGVRA